MFGTIACTFLMSMPARSNMPPGVAKSFCMSTTTTAVVVGPKLNGAGRAGTSIASCLSAIPASPPKTVDTTASLPSGRTHVDVADERDGLTYRTTGLVAVLARHIDQPAMTRTPTVARPAGAF